MLVVLSKKCENPNILRVFYLNFCKSKQENSSKKEISKELKKILDVNIKLKC